MISPIDFGLQKIAYDVTETVSMLSIGRTTLYGLVKSGDIRATKLGRRTLFLAVDIAAFLTKLRNQWPEELPPRDSKSGSASP